MSDIKDAIASATKSVTKSWKQEKRKADRNDRVSFAGLSRLRAPSLRVTIREVAFQVMEDAYNKASSNGRYYANARQIMYAARPAILAECDAQRFESVYFTQTLLKDYLEEYQPGWKVVWDARGNLIEPHTKKKVALGGIGVGDYMNGWHQCISCEAPEVESRIDTDGPGNRYAAVLFIEKEGFTEILKHAGLAERYDIAIMSTKGIPVDAACDLIARFEDEGVRTFVLHDFDLSGFKIVRTLQQGTRLSVGTDVVDLGLRMADIDGLPLEPVTYKQQSDPRIYLQYDCDATEEEAAYLVQGRRMGRWEGERVEINAMTSEQLIGWLESKLEAHGVKKLVPDDDTLLEAYRRALYLQRLDQEIGRLKEGIEDEDDEHSPNGLSEAVAAKLKESPSLSWDEAIWNMANDDIDARDE